MGVSFISEPILSPPLAAGLMPEAPLSDWVENGGFNDCSNVIMKDGRAAFGPGYKQLEGGDIDALTEGVVERHIAFRHNSHIGIVITNTSLFYIDDDGFSQITSAGINDDHNCVDLFTHSSGTYVSYAIGIYHVSTVPYDVIWFTNGTDPIYQFSTLTNTVTEILTTEFPAGARPQQVTYKDRRWWFLGIGATKPTILRWPTLNTEDFSDATMTLELPSKGSAPTGIINFNQFMIIFYPDLIYIGQQTNNYSLPYQFQTYAVRGIGMTTTRGYTIYGNSIYFMCDYRLFVMGLDLSVKQIDHYLTRDMIKNFGTSVFLGCDETLNQILIGSTGTTFMYAYNPIMDRWGKLKYGAGDLNTPSSFETVQLTSSKFEEPLMISNNKLFQMGYGTGYTYSSIYIQTGPVNFDSIETKKTINELGLQIRSTQAIPALAAAMVLRKIDNTTETCGTLAFLNPAPAFSAFEKYTGLVLKYNQFVFEYTITAAGVALLDITYIDALYWNVIEGPVSLP